jgi:hypothetical protein
MIETSPENVGSDIVFVPIERVAELSGFSIASALVNAAMPSSGLRKGPSAPRSAIAEGLPKTRTEKSVTVSPAAFIGK